MSEQQSKFYTLSGQNFFIDYRNSANQNFLVEICGKQYRFVSENEITEWETDEEGDCLTFKKFVANGGWAETQKPANWI